MGLAFSVKGLGFRVYGLGSRAAAMGLPATTHKTRKLDEHI